MHNTIFHNSQQNLVGTKEELEKINYSLIKNGHLTGRLGLLLIQPGTLYRVYRELVEGYFMQCCQPVIVLFILGTGALSRWFSPSKQTVHTCTCSEIDNCLFDKKFSAMMSPGFADRFAV